ncbi:MAG: hypothetical protein ACK5X3_04610 [Pseudomonadota bacterium]|jgi:hypothetical protein
MTNYNITVYQGATFKMRLNIKNSQGIPLDLTGHIFAGQIRRTVSSSSIEAAFSFTLLNQLTNPGEVDCTIADSVTSAIVVDSSTSAERKITKMCYDIESENSGGETVRWMQGLVDVVPEATR